MDSERGIGGNPVKREFSNEEDLEMVNYEMPMQIEVPDLGEVDPLMPVETEHEPAETPQPSSSLYFVRPMKSEVEMQQETPDDIDESELRWPKIDSVISNAAVATNQICDLHKSGVFGPAASSDKSNSETLDFQEITIEPKQEISERVAASAEIIQLDDEDEQPEIGQRHQLLFNYRQQTEITEYPHFNGFERLRFSADRSNADAVQQFVHALNEPQPGRQDGQSHTNAQQSQEHTLTSSHPSLPTHNEQCTLSNNSNPVVGTELESQQENPGCESQNSSHPAAANAHSSGIESPIMSEPVSVTELLRHPFLGGFWTDKQKNAIVSRSRPTPAIDTLTNVSTQLFYDKVPWLCGCGWYRKFFCWPCLLFSYNSTDAEVWSIPATLALKDKEFIHSCEVHRSSQCHLDAVAKLYLRNPAGPPETECEKRNPSGMKDILVSEKVQRNRMLLSLLVQSVCYLRKENPDARTADYTQCFSFVALSNKKLQEALREFQGSSTLESAKNFAFNYAPLVENSVEQYVKSRISEELKDARFVSLFMEDLSRIVDKSTVALIAHFIDQSGDPQQRIIGVHEIGHQRSAGSIFTLFERSVFKLGLRMKVAGFTYSATLVHPSEITAFNARVERFCPNAKCFHYQGHNLLAMLFGALSHLKISNFFQSITELQVFFKKHLIFTFHHYEQLHCINSPQATYDFDYGFVTTLKHGYSSVLETFARILRCPGEWDNAITSQAPFFMNFLKQTTTRFLIVLIALLNSAVSDVTKVLQGKIEPANWKVKIRETISNLMSIKNFGFEGVYLTAMSPNLDREVQKTGTVNLYPQELLCIFMDVIDTAIVFFHQRFVSDVFGYVDFDSVAKHYYARLRLQPTEIKAFRSQIEYLVKESVFKSKSLPEAVKTLRKQDLAKVVPHYATFLNFALTIPSSNTSLYCPAVEGILKYQRDACKFSSESLVWLEKELLAEISSEQNLSEAVIDILATRQNGKQFSYESFGDLIVIQ